MRAKHSGDRRLKGLKTRLRKEGKFPYLVSDLVNIRYLTGFSGTHAYFLVDDSGSYLISDSRYEEYARSILPPSIRFVLQNDEATVSLKQVMKTIGKKELYLEDHALVLSVYLEIKRALRGVKCIAGGNEVNLLRMVKDKEEIALLRKAARLTDECVDHLKMMAKPGMSEWDLSVEIDHFYRKRGCDGSSFDSIVASGSGSSMPHYQTSKEKRIEKNDVLLIDMGCSYRGYNSDLTRTFFLGSIDAELERIYGVVKRAQETAVKAVRPGITTASLDSVARDIIAAEGYGDYFGHSLGHGLGADVHELPAIKKGGDIKLKKGMVITIEPGIYLPGHGGVRIEDMVLVTSRGHRVLTKSSKKLTVIGSE
jgi:Xaa-Pro aminopeptidase